MSNSSAQAQTPPAALRRVRKLLPWALVCVPLFFAARAATDYGAASRNELGPRTHSGPVGPGVAPASANEQTRPAPRADAKRLLKLTTALGSTPAERGDDNERALVHVYALIADGHLARALPRAEQLAQRTPYFALAQLALGDVYRAKAGAAFGFGAVPAADAATEPTLAALRAEARARVDAYAAPPPAGAIPSNLVTLAGNVRHALVVDTGASRLYLFAVANGVPRLQQSFYFSQGKLGAGKTAAGDMKTPLGIYFITRKIGAAQLKPLYGAGALTLNYPNEWDKRAGHTGLGIWLHGSPPGSYARVPLASDGCVVLSNPDLQRLAAEVEPGTTPVVITPSIHWLSPAAWAAQRQQAIAQMQPQVHAAAAQGLRPQDAASAAALPASSRVMDAQANLQPGSYSILQYPGQRVVQYTSSTDPGQLYRQYWAQGAAGWQLIFQGSVS